MGAHKGRCANAVVVRGVSTETARGVLGDVTASSTQRQRSGNAVKARRMRCERRGRAVKAS